MGGGGNAQAAADGKIDMTDFFARYLSGSPQPQQMSNYQSTYVPRESPPIGGIDIPPADLYDPFSVYSPHELGASFGFGGGNPMNNPYLNPNFVNGGPTTQNPFGGQNTLLPTFWDSQGYPFAVPVSTGDVNATAPNWLHAGQTRKNV